MEGPVSGNGYFLGMRIIVIDNSLEITGAFKAVFNNICHQDKQKEFFYFIPKGSKNQQLLESKGIPVYTFTSYELNRKIKNIFLFFPFLILNGYRLSRIIKKNKIDIAYQNEIFILSGLVAKLFTRVHVITHIRVLPTVFPKKLYRFWLQLHDRFADKIVCVSFVCEKAARKIYSPKQGIHVFYDFVVPVENLPPIQINDCTNGANILFIGNYTRGKGQDLALEAAGLFRKKYKDYRLTINFYGSDFDYPANVDYRKTLAAYIEENDLTGTAFLNDFLLDVEKAIKDNDLLLNLSVAESYSFVVAEAMSFGIPVIATDSGGPGELIEDDKSGCLVKADAVSLAEAIYRVCTSKEKRVQYSLNSKERIRGLIKTYGGKQRFDQTFEL